MRSAHGWRRNSNRAAGGIHGYGLCGDYHDYGTGFEAASRGQALGSASPVAHWIELCRQLSVCCHYLDQPSPSLAFAHEATPKLIWWNFAHLFMTSLV